MRALILIHRWLGISVSLLMVLWCLSGIVMIYSPYPHVDEESRISALIPIDWARLDPSVLDTRQVGNTFVRFQIEMLAGVPILRLWAPDGPMKLIDAVAGTVLSQVTEDEAGQVAAAYETGFGRHSEHPVTELLSYDQWTVAHSRADRPLFHIVMGDSGGTEVYVSSRSGAIVQATTRRTRFWGWLGAVPHWLYPTILRSRPEAWSRIVIWTSLAGVLLTLSGLVVGTLVLARDTALRRFSPYRGVMWCHHVLGLVFGVLALTWVLSGLMSMNPWGLMNGGDERETRDRLTGGSFTGKEIAALLRSLIAQAPASIRTLDSAALDGRLLAVATRTDGLRLRYDIHGDVGPLTHPEISSAAQRIAGKSATWSLLREEDEYHYGILDVRAVLPVVRVRSAGGDYYYLDPVSGALVDRADAGGRAYRWWHSALHRLDFARALRSTLARSVVMLPLLLGTTVLCGIGCFLAMRYLSA
jgi:hypothetical protein